MIGVHGGVFWGVPEDILIYLRKAAPPAPCPP